MSPTVIVLIILVLVAGWVVLIYNRLVTARNRTQEAWSEIDVELKRRHDLIPNLVETVKGYMGHERQTLEAVTNARAAAVSAGATGDPAKMAGAEGVLTQSLRSLFAVAENYPDLKAIAAFTNLQETLTATEDKVEFSRRFYNTNARDYNIALQRFPATLVAGPFGFKAFAFFEAAAGDREVPAVDFGSGGPPVAGAGAPPAGGGSPTESSGGPSEA
jgi:LemA protein